jgi:hypothetical protein
MGLQNMVKNLLRDARVMTRGEREGNPESRGHRINCESLLSTLWNDVVEPVLDVLNISVCVVVLLEFSLFVQHLRH